MTIVFDSDADDGSNLFFLFILKRCRERRADRTLVKTLFFFIDDLFSSCSPLSLLHVPLLTTLFYKDNNRERGRNDVLYRKTEAHTRKDEKENKQRRD